MRALHNDALAGKSLLPRVYGTLKLSPLEIHIAKMLVHRKARRRGIAQRLMEAIEDAAREEDKSVLVLDTVTGGDAERLYERAGWQRVGDVPKYALMPNGEFCGTTFFYKHI